MLASQVVALLPSRLGPAPHLALLCSSVFQDLRSGASPRPEEPQFELAHALQPFSFLIPHFFWLMRQLGFRRTTYKRSQSDIQKWLGRRWVKITPSLLGTA